MPRKHRTAPRAALPYTPPDPFHLDRDHFTIASLMQLLQGLPPDTPVTDRSFSHKPTVFLVNSHGEARGVTVNPTRQFSFHFEVPLQ